MKNSSFLPSLLSAAFVLLALCGGSHLSLGGAGILFVGATTATSTAAAANGEADGEADGGTAAAPGEVRVEVTKQGNGPFLVKGNTYATFLTLYYVNDQGEKTFSGFTT